MSMTQCPKCASREIYTGRSNDEQGGFSLGMFTNAKLVYYACVACGYVETYLAREEDKAAIKQAWAMVNA